VFSVFRERERERERECQQYYLDAREVEKRIKKMVGFVFDEDTRNN